MLYIQMCVCRGGLVYVCAGVGVGGICVCRGVCVCAGGICVRVCVGVCVCARGGRL